MRENALDLILLKIFTVNRATNTAICFWVLFVKILVVEYREYHRPVFLVESFRMSIRQASYDNCEFSTLIYRGHRTFGGRGGGGGKTQRRDTWSTCFWHDRSRYICLPSSTAKKSVFFLRLTGQGSKKNMVLYLVLSRAIAASNGKQVNKTTWIVCGGTLQSLILSFQ